MGTVNFRNMTVHVNFGPEPLAPLPFKCKMVADGLTKDVAVKKADPVKAGKCDVVVPVALPDEGPFDFLDLYHQKNPGYTEISDRAIVDWAVKSGVYRRGYKTTNDKPEMGSGIQNLDDGSVSRFLK